MIRHPSRDFQLSKKLAGKIRLVQSAIARGLALVEGGLGI